MAEFSVNHTVFVTESLEESPALKIATFDGKPFDLLDLNQADWEGRIFVQKVTLPDGVYTGQILAKGETLKDGKVVKTEKPESMLDGTGVIAYNDGQVYEG